MKLAETNYMTESNNENKESNTIFGTENIPYRIRKGNLIPYKVVTNDIVENTDVCIIGSGAAGAILANKILKGIQDERGNTIVEGKNVILIEKGGYYDPEDFNQRESSMMKLLWKNGGIQFNDDLSLVIAQGECLGGSTMINDAVCFNTPNRIIKDWQDDHGIDYSDDEWANAIKEVKEKLSVKVPSDKEIMTNKNAEILKEGCNSLKIHGLYNERNCTDCGTCGTCHLGCHYQTKQDMLNTYLHEALHFDKNVLKIFCNCDVRKINYKDGTATGIEGKFLGKDGVEKFKIKVNAKVIILSAGSIASSALLLSNNIAPTKAGKYLSVHPSTVVIAKFKDEIRASEGIPMAYSCDQFSILNYKNNGRTKGGFMLESIFTPIGQFSLLLPYHLPDKYIQDYQHYAMAGVLVRDEPCGTIELSKKGHPKIHYKLGKDELNDLVEGIGTLIKLFFSQKAEEVIIRHGNTHVITKEQNNEIDIKKILQEIHDEHNNGGGLTGLGSAHPQGGNKMGKDRESCVVDKHCQVYDFKNLFVCDASVFPTALGVNPQITVMALATMTAENILKNWNHFEYIGKIEHAKDFCDINHPRTCGLETLSLMFNQVSNNGDVTDLVNASPNDSAGWTFDKNSLMIKNKFHWRGFIPDPEFPESLQPFLDDGIIDWYDDYLEGFWKKFEGDEIQGIDGKLNVYFMENKDFRIFPEKIHHEIYGSLIKLTYPKIPNVYDLIKIVNEENIIGKVFVSFPPLYPDLELGPFVMSKEYSAEWMDDDDHERIVKVGEKIELTNLQGYWALRRVKKHLLSPVVHVFHVKNGETIIEDEKINSEDISKKEPIGKALELTILKDLNWIKIGDGLTWTNHTFKINENFMVGKLTSSQLDDSVNSYSDIIENEKGKKVFVIRYTLATVGGAWVRDQD